MTLRELTQLVAAGEGLYLEFKRRVPQPERIAKEVIALANTHGGRLLLGVDDDGSIVGVRDAEEEEFALQTALRAWCHPVVEVRTERVPITKKRDVIIVGVPESVDKPHYLQNGKANGRAAYVRVADMSVEASAEAIRLMEERDPDSVFFRFGDQEQLLMRYLDTYGRITVEQFANVADLAEDDARDILVTLAQAEVLHLHHTDRQDYFTVAL